MVEVRELEKQIIATGSCTQPSQYGNEITVLCQDFVDRVFVSVTQKGKVGYVAQSYSAVSQANEQREPTVSFTSLFGMPPIGMEDIYALYAKQLALFIYALSNHSKTTDAEIYDTCKPMVIALALDQISADDNEIDFAAERDRLAQIQSMLQQCRVW